MLKEQGRPGLVAFEVGGKSGGLKKSPYALYMGMVAPLIKVSFALASFCYGAYIDGLGREKV